MTASQARQAHARYMRALRRAEALREERDDAIRALIADGHSHAQVHQILHGLDGAPTRARVGQIAKGTR